MISLHKSYVKSVNQDLNTKIEERAKTLISFIENTTKVEIKRIQIKFVEDIYGELFFIGIINDILYFPKGINMNQTPFPVIQLDDSALFGGSRIMNDKTNWKNGDRLPVCYGEFCEYVFQESYKFISYRGKKIEFEKNFKSIPDKNKIYNVLLIFINSIKG